MVYVTKGNMSSGTAAAEGHYKNYKPVILPPFSITAIHGFTKLKGFGMWLNLIAELIIDNQLPQSIQYTSIYYDLGPGSSRV